MVDLSQYKPVILNDASGERVRDATIEAMRALRRAKAPPITSMIQIYHLPNKLDYAKNGRLKLDGIVVVAKRRNGEWVDVTSLCETSPGDGEALIETEEETVSVIYREEHITLGTEFKVSIDSTLTDTGLGWSADERFLIYSAGTDLGIVNDRHFYKSNNGYVLAFFRHGSKYNGWTGPVLYSTLQNNALFRYGTTTVPTNATETYLETLWYINRNHHYQNPSSYSNSGGLVDSDTFSESVIEAARVRYE